MHAGGQSVEGRSDARRRQMLAIVASVVIAAVAVVGYVVISGRGGSSAASSPAVVSHSTTRSAAPSLSNSATPIAIPAVYASQVARNPFKPLVVAPVALASALSSTSSTPTPTQSPTPIVIVLQPSPTPTPTQTQAPTPSVTVTANPSPTGLPTAGQAITLTLDAVDLTAGTVNVTVSQGSTSKQYTGVKPGTVFGTYFKLVSVLSSDPNNPPVVGGADFEYGDQFVQLAQGEWAQFG